jgi:osmotically-inducible protein OsmY
MVAAPTTKVEDMDGYQQSTDEHVEADVRAELSRDGRLDPREVAVRVDAGVVTLQGTVGSLPQKHAAEEAAKRVKDATGVRNELEVRPLDLHLRQDAELRAQVLQALADDALLPQTIDARASDGIVTLHGTVADAFQRDEAALVVGGVEGVRGVHNELAVESRSE